MSSKREFHGMRRRREYNIWSNMKSRCSNPLDVGYHRYGGRGISVSEEWKSFSNFFRDMGECPPGMSLDRIDNNGGYCKENCRWADRKTQNRNTRRNVYIDVNGNKMCMLDAAAAVGLKMSVVRSRIRLGWSKKQAIGIDPPPLRGTERLVTVNGETMRLASACRKYGVSHQCFKGRISLGWGIEEAFGLIPHVHRSAKFVMYNGKEIRVSDLCRDKGILQDTFYTRVKRGWSVEKAADTPVKSKSHCLTKETQWQ